MQKSGAAKLLTLADTLIMTHYCTLLLLHNQSHKLALTTGPRSLLLDTVLQERVVNVTSIIIGVERVPVVRVQLSMLPETLRKVRIGEVMSPKANQVCMILLQGLNCTLTVVPACRTAQHSLGSLQTNDA
jgi:hypothetical protein